ncbi:Cochaperone prefoldin complex subunit [Spiromyces aspiralis]|uniref:Cochaperone prefoldin complex subunit n=1 Tax=Spiromyces aspiralis TaxID=68401 RepID=A0ACC1HSM8_9FUNG|nr:Cochaperone prefoldin complex subunit [Spiromyces aspiralis]
MLLTPTRLNLSASRHIRLFATARILCSEQVSKPRPTSSVAKGAVLKGLNVLKDGKDPVALADEEYPGWLWTLLDKPIEEELGERKRLNLENTKRIKAANFLKSRKTASMSTSASSQPARISPAIANELNKYKQELQGIASKIGELEMEVDEHSLVIDTMKPLNADRKCFRLVNGVLVERTVKEVLPALEANRKGIKDVVEKLLEEYKKKEKAFKELQAKHDVNVADAE